MLIFLKKKSNSAANGAGTELRGSSWNGLLSNAGFYKTKLS